MGFEEIFHVFQGTFPDGQRIYAEKSEGSYHIELPGKYIFGRMLFVYCGETITKYFIILFFGLL
jgi:hypothetical protein